MHFSIDRIVHTTAFDKPVVDHWLERKITQTAAWSTEKDRSDDRPLQRRARYRLSYIPLHDDNDDDDDDNDDDNGDDDNDDGDDDDDKIMKLKLRQCWQRWKHNKSSTFWLPMTL